MKKSEVFEAIACTILGLGAVTAVFAFLIGMWSTLASIDRNNEAYAACLVKVTPEYYTCVEAGIVNCKERRQVQIDRCLGTISN